MRRRDVLRALGASALAGAGIQWPESWSTLLPGAALRRAPSQAFDPDVELSLEAAPGEAAILPGPPTEVWRFTGAVVKGQPDALQELPGSYLGPVIRLRRGQRVRIRFTNRIPEHTIVHWHGLDVPSTMDGHPHLAIASGVTYVYEFEVTNRAGTYWYHPHPHARTGAQVYRGLAGVLVVSDDEEAAAGLPRGAQELICVLQDRRFDDRNQLQHPADMMTQRHGFLGDRMLVNGRERPSLSLATRAYRLRLLNGSSSRVYRLVWSDETPMTVIGSDGGLLERPSVRRSLTLAPAQRADVIVDLSGRPVGATLDLRSAPFPAGEIDPAGGGGMGRGMGASGPVPQGAALSLLTLRIDRSEAEAFRMPERLSTFNTAWRAPADGPSRRIELSFAAGQWLLGGRTFQMMDVADDEVVRAGASQVWEVANVGGMMGSPMAHPLHVHGPQFRVLSRTRPAGETPPSVAEGLLDDGWTDTVLVLPRETVRLHVHFTRHPGLYLYHCHILDHEDLGMMRNFHVVPA